MAIRRQLLLLSITLACGLMFLTVGISAWAGSPFVESDVIVIHSFSGETANDNFGWVGADVGDLNGDGAGEFIVTAPLYSVTAPFQGRAYLYSGSDGSVLHTMTGEAGNLLGYSASGVGDANNDDVPDYVVSGPGFPGRVVVYSGADHSVLHDLAGKGGGFGVDVAGVEDVNGDAHDDLIVGAETYSEMITNTGRVYLISGMDGITLWTREGGNEEDRLGTGVGFVGDVNGDTVPDVVAAARGANNNNGQAYVFSGTDGSTLRTLDPALPLSNTFTFGQFFASDAGDVNNDNIPDIFIGDYNALNGTGRAYVFSGADGSQLHLFEAENTGDGFGPGRGIGDINGDNHDDLIIAAYTNSEGAPAGGKNYIFSGADGSILNTATGNVANIFLGVDALGIGDITNDGNPDYLTTGFGQVHAITFDSNPTAVTLHTLESQSREQAFAWLGLALVLLGGVGMIWRRVW